MSSDLPHPHRAKRTRHQEREKDKDHRSSSSALPNENVSALGDPPASAHDNNSNPFMPMFGVFCSELDEHHDRRERVIKASRDVTALSKKM